jgi:hypothetical protein
MRHKGSASRRQWQEKLVFSFQFSVVEALPILPEHNEGKVVHVLLNAKYILVF